MRKARFALILLVLLAAGCSNNETPVQTEKDPGHSQGQLKWLDELIADLENEPVRNPPAYVASYTYNGETVYYVPPYCCDAMSVLYDSEGNRICAPDGGLTGRGDGKCPDFFEARSDETIIWRDPRER